MAGRRLEEGCEATLLVDVEERASREVVSGRWFEVIVTAAAPPGREVGDRRLIQESWHSLSELLGPTQEGEGRRSALHWSFPTL